MPVPTVVPAAILPAGLLLALFGPPPPVRRPFESLLVRMAALGMLLIAVGMGLEYDVELGAVLVAPAVAAFCLSCWLARGPEGRGDDGGGGGGDDGPGPDGPIDWDDFDRARALWARSRPRVPA
jgi:hypothetical protein